MYFAVFVVNEQEKVLFKCLQPDNPKYKSTAASAPVVKLFRYLYAGSLLRGHLGYSVLYILE